MPLELQQAYKNGTRSFKGESGKHYWQNKAKYDISVQIHPSERKIAGEERIQYFNNSPDTLKELWVHLYADFYKKGNARDEKIVEENLTKGIILNAVHINGQPVDVENAAVAERTATNLVLHLPESLLPGETLLLDISWTEWIPPTYHNRIGAYDSSTFFIGYWYPQVAVYDDVDGWDTFDYGGIQEFYRDFNDYDVKIKVPGNYLIWSTGTLQNPEEVYPPHLLQKWEAAKHSSTPVCIVEGQRSYPLAHNQHKIWHFKATAMGDFAFGMSNGFRWEATHVVIPETPGNKVLVNTVFDPADSTQLSDITAKQQKMLTYYSGVLPGMAYPYPHFTTFVGCPIYDGMEFPMIANNGVYRGEADTARLKDIEVTAHEMAHIYFPFYVGINERKYTWMEEGWAVFLTTHMLKDTTQQLLLVHPPNIPALLDQYLEFAGSQYESPLLTSSILLRNAKTHRHLSYIKSYWAYSVLQNLLGESMFASCLKEYIKRWRGKHPTPYDFFFTFNDASGQNLDWFWKAWFQDFGYADLGVYLSNKGVIAVKNEGGLPVPFHVELTYADGSIEKIHKNAGAWMQYPSVYEIPINPAKTLQSARLCTQFWPDVKDNNNKIIPDNVKKY